MERSGLVMPCARICVTPSDRITATLTTYRAWMPAETPIAVNTPTTDTEATTSTPSLTLMLWKRSSGRTSRARSTTVPPTLREAAFRVRDAGAEAQRDARAHRPAASRLSPSSGSASSA